MSKTIISLEFTLPFSRRTSIKNSYRGVRAKVFGRTLAWPLAVIYINHRDNAHRVGIRYAVQVSDSEA